MYGIGATLRPYLQLAKPWQRMALGVVMTVVGVFTGLYVVSAIGIVLVVLPVVGWFKRRGVGREPKGTGAEISEQTSEP